MYVCTHVHTRKSTSLSVFAFLKSFASSTLLHYSTASQCSLWAVFGGAAPPHCANTPPFSVSEAAAPPPIRVMACKADLYSIVITKQFYPCKYTAISCAIVALVEDRDWIKD